MAENKKNKARQDSEQVLFGRQKIYQSVFDKESPTVQELLKDLAEFCHANKTTFHADPRVHAAMEGRREVFLRITAHLDLDSQTLWELYTGVKY